MLYTIRPTYKVLSEETDAKCEVCGSTYWIQASKAAGSRYCSRACQGAARSARSGGAPSKEELAHLYYNEKLSMQSIARHFSCSVNKIAYWMEQYRFERRERSEASYLFHNPTGDPFTITVPQTVEAGKLFGMGIGIYMGEGDKTDPSAISLSNSNPGVHKVFVKFLEEICGVPRSQLGAMLQLYTDLDVETTTQWWANELGLDRSQFTEAWVREGKEGSYKTKVNKGTLVIRFHNTKLKALILEWCRLEYERHSK